MPVPIVGLTGGVASGKSSVSALLKAAGLKIIDADALVKSIYQKEATINEVSKLVPNAVSNQIIDFKVLRESFFSNQELQAQIEKLIYSQMPQAFKLAYENDVKGKQDFIIYDVPLLFEKDLAARVDVKVCVWCEPQMQIARLLKRDHITEDLAQKMLARQWDINLKRDQSDIVIDNSKSMDELANSTSLFLESLSLK